MRKFSDCAEHITKLTQPTLTIRTSKHVFFFVTALSVLSETKLSNGKISLLSAPGSVLIKTTLVKSLAEAFLCTQTVCSCPNNY